MAKNLSDEEREGLMAAVGASPGDCAFFAAGPRADALALLGSTRVEIGRRGGLIDDTLPPAEQRWAFCWVVDAPMFEPDGEGGWTAVHHPFTGPTADYAADFEDRPGEALAHAYDIVCNGNEIGGGSIRIHRADMQQRVFDVLGISRTRPRPSSASCLRPSSTDLRRTAASPSAGTAPACCSPGPTPSATWPPGPVGPAGAADLAVLLPFQNATGDPLRLGAHGPAEPYR